MFLLLIKEIINIRQVVGVRVKMVQHWLEINMATIKMLEEVQVDQFNIVVLLQT